MIRLFNQYFSPRKSLFIMGEGLLIYLAILLASLFLLKDGLTAAELFEIIWLKALLVTMVTQFSLYFNDLYDFKNSNDFFDTATRLIQSIGMTSVALAIIYFLFPAAIIGRWIFFFSLVFLISFLVSWRLLYIWVIRKRLFADRTILLGSGELAKDIIREISDRKDLSYDIRLIVSHGENTSRTDFDGIPVHYGFNDIYQLAKAKNASNIIVALDQRRGILPYNELLECKMKGLSIIDGESFYERIAGKLLVDKINPSWLIFSEGFVTSTALRFVKRCVDLIFSSITLITLSPLMLFISIAIKLDSRGPVLFSQERVGENEQLFTLYKFRSMKCDAEKESGPVWACENDPRVTRVGRIIRRLRIDELPQLWNVLKGNISFVGPRPERPYFVEKLKRIIPYYKERFSVKPGITGWAQIKYGYGSSQEDALEKLRYDLYYIKNLSLAMDLVIIFHTFKIVLLVRGSR